ncbi:EsV-1-7 [Ectocarpus siliculosus]|uniref:EsV-1-7 n=1 Tax=Ectocarpus siliculosus TaxID=2880 RepID=D8LKX9_ECTSI|nr:EsV-1-7 [Ectocarpus siliculosus]|eukprot:CBN80112.1 EsV-1-7 [Ectocarpus siliculosus]
MENESRKNATDMLGDLVTKPSAAGTPSRHYKPTPPPTPPSACSPYRSVSEGGSSETCSPHSLRKGITAPTTAVDDVVEKFGRPRARSLSRRDLSLPPLEEEAPEIVRLEDRRRTVSMSITEGHRYDGGGGSRSARQASAVNKRCLDCNLPPSFAMEGEPAIFCRAHQMEGMVNVLREGCTTQGCCRTASYGLPGEGRQRCFSHMDKGMVHVLQHDQR